MDQSQFGGSFWITIAGIVFGFLGLGIRFALKSKCKKCGICCGLFTIERNIEAEIEEEKLELELGINPYEIKNSNSLAI